MKLVNVKLTICYFAFFVFRVIMVKVIIDSSCLPGRHFRALVTEVWPLKSP